MYQPYNPDSTPLVLRCHDLHKRHWGVCDLTAQLYSASVNMCMERHHASKSVDFAVQRNSLELVATVEWSDSIRLFRHSHAADRATEFAAYAIALATIELTDELVALTWAYKGSRVDYFLVPAKEADAAWDDLENAIPLSSLGTVGMEVSGVDAGNTARVNTRVKAKREQARSSPEERPAIACVVAFLLKKIILKDVDKP
jgi:hypothetical protein